MPARLRGPWLCAAGALALAAACGPREAPEPEDDDASAGEWTLAGPMQEVDVASDPSDDVHEVVDAARLADGRILVLDAGAAELRMFDSKGVFLTASGGRGDGPGEFRRPARLHLLNSDSVLVDDPVLRRTSLFDTGGRFVRAEPWPRSAEPFPRDVWLHGRHLVVGPRRTDLRGPVRRAIGALPRPGPGGWRTVVVDPQWRLWLRAEPHDPNEPTLWTVWDLRPRRLAHLRLPAGLRPTHFGPDFLVGVAADGPGVQTVRVYAVEGAPEDGGAAEFVMGGDETESNGVPTSTPAAVQRLTDALRHIQAAQEQYYTRPDGDFSYAASIDRLDIDEADLHGVEPHVLSAGPRGYTVLAFDAREPVACGMTIGIGGPIGWAPASVLCH